MENGNKKKEAPINEELMMSLMVDGVRKEGLRPPIAKPAEEEATPHGNPVPGSKARKEKYRSRKTDTADYESLFFKRPETNARDGKTVYIRPDFHERLSRIVQVIGGDKITLYAYLDNLLEYHFREFGDQITDSFNDKYKPIL